MAKTFLRRSAHGTRQVRAGRSSLRGGWAGVEDEAEASAGVGAAGGGAGVRSRPVGLATCARPERPAFGSAL